MKRTIVFISTLFFLACSSEKKDAANVERAIQEISRPNFTGMIGRDFLIDDQHSYIGFRIKYFGSSNVRGRFDRFKGTAFYDTVSRFISSTIVIDVTSINTGDKRRDEDLKQGAWFETSRFPSVTFTSLGTALTPDGLVLRGVLKIKNVSKDIALKLNRPTLMTKDWAGNDQVDFSGEFTLYRKEFGIEGDGFWNEMMENGVAQLSDEVLVEIEIHARRADYLVRKDNPELIDSVALILLKEVSQEGFENVASRVLNKNIGHTDRAERSTLYDFGYVLMSEGKHNEARQVFDRLTQLYPDKINDLNLLGVCYLLEGETQQAKAIFNRVIAGDSLNVKAMEYLRNMQ